MSRCVVMMMLLSLAGCRCRPGPVEPVELGFRVQPPELDFGRVLEGSQKTLTLKLTAETRSPVEVALSTDAPFSVGEAASIPGGSEVDVAITFAAGSEAVERVLRLTVGDRTAEVKLRGVGVRPPACVPSGECIISTYSLEEDRCIETQSPDDAPCDPSSVCLEQGRCRSGECLGIARRCDDGDLCTDDACAMDVGCVHTPHACPTPTAACTVATCDPQLGCGEGPAADLTPCGPLDCVSVNFCVSGVCRNEPTPDGLPCSPAIACLPEATCQNQQCTRVNVGDWTPDWSAPLPSQPSGAIAALSSNLFLSVCAIDAGSHADAGVVDGGEADAGEVDAGDVDAGELDAGDIDAGDVEDAGASDGGADDAGFSMVCSLTSFTGTGFERFTWPYEDGQPRSLRAVSNAGVLLAVDGGLELRSQATGALRHALWADLGGQQWALGSEGAFVILDGGLSEWVDGGVRLLADVGAGASLVRGNALLSWNASSGLLTEVTLLADGGAERRDVMVTGVSTSPLITADGLAIFPGYGRVRMEADGGADALTWDLSDAGVIDELASLASLGTMNGFFSRCDGGCETWVRNIDLLTGAARFEGRVLRGEQPSRIITSSLVDNARGAFVVLVREDGDAGARAYFELFVDGESRALCRLPEASGAVAQAVLSSSALVITAERPDGGAVLESYGLGNVPTSRFGWATPTGVGGTRSDRQ